MFTTGLCQEGGHVHHRAMSGGWSCSPPGYVRRVVMFTTGLCQEGGHVRHWAMSGGWSCSPLHFTKSPAPFVV